MTYEMYRMIYLVALIAGCIMAVTAIVLFFTLQIPRVIGDLTGRTARRAIEDIRKQNEQSGEKTFAPSHVNKQRGKLTDKITHSGRIVKREESPLGVRVVTERLAGQQAAQSNPAAAQAGGNETTLLYPEAGETAVLDPVGETSVLDAAGDTTVLYQPAAAPVANASQEFVIEYEITFVHGDEEIR